MKKAAPTLPGVVLRCSIKCDENKIDGIKATAMYRKLAVIFNWSFMRKKNDSNYTLKPALSEVKIAVEISKDDFNTDDERNKALDNIGDTVC